LRLVRKRNRQTSKAGAGSPKSVLRLPSVRISVAVLFVVAFMAAFGSTLAPHDPLGQDVTHLYKSPSLHHLFGTDYLGRDVFSRMMAGTRLSVLTALEAVGIGLAVGTLPGIAAALIGSWFDWIVNRIVDGLMTLPFIFFAVAFAAAFGNKLWIVMIPIGLLVAPAFFRVTRAATLQFTTAQYVEAAELLGASQWRIVRTHVWSKVLPTIAVTTAIVSAAALLAVTFLTFLGIGVQPPAPSWGGILSSDLQNLAQNPWAPIFPGAVIAITVGSLNALADALRDRTSSAAPSLSELFRTGSSKEKEAVLASMNPSA
jgi:peptide/nickel transport system permease protein